MAWRGRWSDAVGTNYNTGGCDGRKHGRLIKNKKKIYYCGQAVVHHPVDLARTKLKFCNVKDEFYYV